MGKLKYEMPRITEVKKISIDKLGAKLEAEPRLKFTEKLYEKFPQAEIYVVGGTVRDCMMGQDISKDYDLVIRKVPADELAEALQTFGEVNLVGARFGVFKLRLADDEPGVKNIEIALPRRETAAGTGGYRDFDVQSDPSLSIEEDLSRRDFTWNAMAWELRQKKLVDPFHGILDLEAREVRAVGKPEERFQEDYSRMLRALRFGARFGFKIEDGTKVAIQELAPHINDEKPTKKADETEYVVARETVAKEFLKALYADPVRAIELYEEVGMLYQILPELQPMVDCDQMEEWHSEGTVWKHTKLALSHIKSEGFRTFFGDKAPSPEVVFAVLLHDVAKPQTKSFIDVDGKQRMVFYGHDKVGAEVARDICRRLKVDSVEDLDVSTDRVVWLVQYHLFTLNVNLDTVKNTTLESYFFDKKYRGEDLLHVSFADASASIPKDGVPDLANLRKLMGRLEELKRLRKDSPTLPKPLLAGEEIMKILNIKPGPKVGKVILELREAQLSGHITTEGDAVDFIENLKS